MKQKMTLKSTAQTLLAMVLAFVLVISCKDYDSEIKDLQESVTMNKAAIATIKSALETFKNEGKLVKEVASTSNGIQLIFTDGTSYGITNGTEGADGKKGTVVEVKGGELYVEGKATGIKANSEDNLKISVKDAELYVNGEATGIKKQQITAVKTESNVIIVFTDGTKAVIPFATATLKSIVFVPNYSNSGNEAVIYSPRYKFKYVYVEKEKPGKSDVGPHPEGVPRKRRGGGGVVPIRPYGNKSFTSTEHSANRTTNWNPSLDHSRVIYLNTLKKPIYFTEGYEVEIDVNPVNFDITHLKSLDFESKISKVLVHRNGVNNSPMQVLRNDDGSLKIQKVEGIPGRYVLFLNGHTFNDGYWVNGHIRINNPTYPGTNYATRNKEVEKVQLSATLKSEDDKGTNIQILSDWVTPYSPSYCIWPIIARDYEKRGEEEIDEKPPISYINNMPTRRCYAYYGDYDLVSGHETTSDMLEVSVPVRNPDNSPHILDLRKVVKLIAKSNGNTTNYPRNTTHENRGVGEDVNAACCPDNNQDDVEEERCQATLGRNCKNLDELIKGYGLHYEFYPMEHIVYRDAVSSTNQNDYVELVDPKTSSSGAEYTLGPIKAANRVGNGAINSAIGRSPIFQVRLVDKKNNVWSLAYIRLKFVPKHVTPKVFTTNTYNEVVFTECKPTTWWSRDYEIRKYNPEGKYDGLFISSYDWTNDEIYTKGPFAALGGIDTEKFSKNYEFNRTDTQTANAPNNSISSDCYSGELFDVRGLIDGGAGENNTGTDLFSVAKKATCARKGEYLVAVVFTRKTDDIRYPAKVIVKVKVVVKDFSDGNFWNYTTDTNAGKRVSGYWLPAKKDDTFDGTTKSKDVIVAKGEPVFDYNRANGSLVSNPLDYRGVLPKINLLNGFKSDLFATSSVIRSDYYMLQILREHITGAYEYKFEFDMESHFKEEIGKYNATITASTDLARDIKAVVSLDSFPKTNTFIPVKLVVDISDAVDVNGNLLMKQTNPNTGEICWCHTYEKKFLVEFRNPAKVEGHIIMSDVPTTDQYIDLTNLQKMIAVGDIHSNTIDKDSYWRIVPQYGSNVGSTNHYFAETHSKTSFTFRPANDASTHYFEVAGGNVHGIASPTTVMDAVNVTNRANDNNVPVSTQLADLEYVKWLTSGIFTEHTLRFELRKTPNTQNYPVAVKAVNLAAPSPYNTLAAGTGLKPVFLYYGSQQGHATLTQDQHFFIDVWGYYGSGDEVTGQISTIPNLGQTKATAKYYYGEIKVTIKKSE